nr:winged helix-turn-helix domain-containing protein [Micromonospora sp. DSM 115978]
MLISLLGPLDVVEDGYSLKIPGEKLRTLVAVLALNPNHTVSSQALIDELWGESPPRNAENSLQGHVARLRRILADRTGKTSLRTTIQTSYAGYSVVVEPRDVDASLFSDLAERADAICRTDPSGAIGLLTEALRLWRGPALLDTGQGLI